MEDPATERGSPFLPPLPIHALSLGDLMYRNQTLSMPQPVAPVLQPDEQPYPIPLTSNGEPEPGLKDALDNVWTARADNASPASTALSFDAVATCDTDV
ncbi:uncharacterized protein PHACADRAFT_259058 [Phanerochaete carnosa HHB-10118-sp]|uniref:Uncharacterized protein n=1 Tax=Phanerochaete carnosa (strain HHB-10118-sp) TaxID=650164 RepID=K5WWR4_PHACS|nr:uncharacterized protein PHACADRAFT_259058 [Phanerochaete carnosa HHB-10118-sp]EKM54892.1 hypothetical protein PHACADRAFT_259058 [Phanerochaete carnosa HHB-10118-sp]